MQLSEWLIAIVVEETGDGVRQRLIDRASRF